MSIQEEETFFRMELEDRAPRPFGAGDVRTEVNGPHLLLPTAVAASGVDSLDRVKRSIDVLIAVVLLVATLPVMLAIAVVVRLTTPGPALFRQHRLGRDKAPFAMLKFRTMYHECDDELHREFVTRMLTDDGTSVDCGAAVYKLTDDPRITAIGRLLRRTSLDELPQLFNVLRGEMSLVGPRPVLGYEAELLGPQYEARFTVKPGITGLWQVNGRNRLNMRQASDLDVEYVQSRSVWLDLRILLITVPTVAWAAITGQGVG